MLNIEARAIYEQIDSLDRVTVEKVIDLLLSVKPNGHKVITAGCGTSGTVARRIAHTLSVVEVPAFYCSPANSIHGGMGAIQKDDVVVLISKGGNTKEILNYIPCCKKKGAIIIGVTQNDNSVLAKEADIYFKIEAKQEVDRWNMCASSSCNAIIAVWDAIVLVVFLSIVSPAFLKANNLINIIRQVSIVGIIAIGGFMVILTGGMDISVGAVAALTGVVVAKLSIHMEVPLLIAVLAGMGVGLLAGVLNGCLPTFLKLPSFIVTLGTMQICQGLSYVITQATPISNFPPEFIELGRGHLGVVPWPVVILVVLYVLMSLFMKYSKFGTYCYAIGGNSEAARLSGIRVNRIQIMVYILGGLFSAIGGLIVAARTNAGSAQVGTTYLFDVFTACVLGGTALSGGIGRLPGVAVGCIFVGILNNGLVQLNVDSFYQMMVQGIVLVVAVVLQSLLTREKRVKEKK